MGRLDGKVALITGAASGIGKAHAKLFSKEEAKVVITTRKKIVEGTALAEQIVKEGGDAIFIKLDVSKEEEWLRVIHEIRKIYGKLNILVNNAGVAIKKNVENTTLDEWNWLMSVNATGVFLGTKYAIGIMKENHEPCSIINISSIDAMIGEEEAAYCASKGAMRSFTKAVAIYCAESGYKIRVNSIHPGYVRTELIEKEAQDLGLTPSDYSDKLGKMHPIGHIGEPIDIAYMSLYLASDESIWATGSEYLVDGGYTAR